MGNHEQAKRLLRQRLREARHALPAETAASLSANVCARVLVLPAFAHAVHVVAYAATYGEVDPVQIARAAGSMAKAVYYPRVEGERLEFLRAAPTELRPGILGIPEPVNGTPLPVDAASILFFVPGVGFDLRGARLGRGGGHYDRALQRYRGAIRIGLAFETQVVTELPETSWDVRMHAVVTEARVIAFDLGQLTVTKEIRP
jgi:5-formyltetrahydrofolate cyclo-ligase